VAQIDEKQTSLGRFLEKTRDLKTKWGVSPRIHVGFRHFLPKRDFFAADIPRRALGQQNKRGGLSLRVGQPSDLAPRRSLKKLLDTSAT
jgi:hypothetical protein